MENGTTHGYLDTISISPKSSLGIYDLRKEKWIPPQNWCLLAINKGRLDESWHQILNKSFLNWYRTCILKKQSFLLQSCEYQDTPAFSGTCSWLRRLKYQRFLFCFFLQKSFGLFQFPFLRNLLQLARTAVRTLASANFKLACVQYHGNSNSYGSE